MARTVSVGGRGGRRVALAGLALAASATLAAAWDGIVRTQGGSRAGVGAPATIEIAGTDEPGQRLVVSGQVFRPDGTTPAAGVTLYVYQTDRGGLYGPRGEPPRLRGWMTTDGAGRYEYRTIRPGAYPGREIAAHVHTQLWGGGIQRQWNRDLLFADDPLLRDRDRAASETAGRFAWVCAPENDRDGVLHCRHDLRAKPVGDRFEPNLDHGLVPKPEASDRGGRGAA